MKKSPKRLKVCLICSTGGHMNQIMLLSDFYNKHEHYFVTFYRNSVSCLKQKEKVYFIKDPSRKLMWLLLNIFQSIRVLLKEKPDVIISTGAGVAVATCFLGRLLRKKVIFVEDWCRTDRPSFTGRLLYPFAGLFFVQWRGLLRFYPKAIYKGPLI